MFDFGIMIGFIALILALVGLFFQVKSIKGQNNLLDLNENQTKQMKILKKTNYTNK